MNPTAILARLAMATVIAALPAVALAHGEHGAGRALASTVTVQGYEVELLSHPGPPSLGAETHLIAKVTRSSTGEPISGGHVLMGFAPSGVMPDSPRLASETAWAGSHALAVTPARLGAHRLRVVLAELEGRRLDPPLVVDMPVTVEAAPGMGAVGWGALGMAGAIAALMLCGVVWRARTGTPTGEALNLLAVPWVHALVTSRAAQLSMQVPLLGVMAVVVFLGLADVQDGGVNVATKLTWTIWWAGIIFTFLLVGRIWCVACPFGALNEWTARLAGPLRRLPRPFRNIWWATGLFVLLTWADEQLGVVRSPRVTAGIVVMVAMLAIGVGLFFERRSFCRYLCPIGGVIGLYSMTAPLELRAARASVCRADREQACYRGGPASRGCPMLEFPQTMDRNTYCTFCGECVRGCAHDNLVLRLRAFGTDLWASRRRLLDEAYLAVALVGLTFTVTAGMLAAWPGWMSELARWLPSAVRAGVKPVTYLGAVESIVLLGAGLAAAPLLVLAAAVASDRLAGPTGVGPGRTFVTFGYMFVPVGLAMHLAHNLGHLLLEGPGIVPAIQRAALVYLSVSMGEPDWQVGPVMAGPVVTFLQMGVVVALFSLSLVAGHRVSVRVYPDARTAGRALAPMAVLALAFTVLGIVLLNQPMGMRHVM
jgi:4Fe-4S binding protein